MSTRNVVLFGQTGAGKSSLVNLMAGKEIAETSSGIERCTLHWEQHSITFDEHDYNIFDTIGLDEQEFRKTEYLEAMENVYTLIKKLEVEGGIDLLLFCVKAGRVTTTIQANYRLFYEWLCEKKVPVVLVLTVLERERNMEDWWDRNQAHLSRYDIRVDGHACVTAVKGVENEKYEESCRLVRRLVREHTYGRNGDPYNGGEGWYRRFMRMLKKLFSRTYTPRKKDMVTVLTKRCGMHPEAARDLASKISSDSRRSSPVGLEDPLSAPNNVSTSFDSLKQTTSRDAYSQVTDVKSILDSDATRRTKKAAVPRSIPLGFFDDVRDDINPSMTPTNLPPAAACTIPPTAADSDPPSPASTTPADPPSKYRLHHILASFPLSGARALLRRALPVFRHSRPNTNLSTDLTEQHSNQPANVEVPKVVDNQSDATPRLAQDERHPPSPGLLVDVQDRIHSLQLARILLPLNIAVVMPSHRQDQARFHFLVAFRSVSVAHTPTPLNSPNFRKFLRPIMNLPSSKFPKRMTNSHCMLPGHGSLSQPVARSTSRTIHGGLVAFCSFAVYLYQREVVSRVEIRYLSLMSSIPQRIQLNLLTST